MLTHVLRTSIEVFMMEQGTLLRSISHYGQERYGGQQEEEDEEEVGGGGGGGVAVLFHGAGHYEALSKCE
jgi:hypothetical protein